MFFSKDAYAIKNEDFAAILIEILPNRDILAPLITPVEPECRKQPPSGLFFCYTTGPFRPFTTFEAN